MVDGNYFKKLEAVAAEEEEFVALMEQLELPPEYKQAPPRSRAEPEDVREREVRELAAKLRWDAAVVGRKLVQADGEMDQLLALMRHESSESDRGSDARDSSRATSKIGDLRRRKTWMADPVGLHADGEAECERSGFEMAVI